MNKSDFLFAMPDFLGGVSRVLDLGSTMNIYNDSDSPEEADYKAMSSDWQVTGDDIRRALDEFKEDRKGS